VNFNNRIDSWTRGTASMLLGHNHGIKLTRSRNPGKRAWIAFATRHRSDETSFYDLCVCSPKLNQQCWLSRVRVFICVQLQLIGLTHRALDAVN